MVLVLFGIALDADQRALRIFAPGLFWIAVLLCTLLAISRSMDVELADGAAVGLRLSGISPAAVFLGKALAVVAQLLVLEFFLSAGIILLYRSNIEDMILFLLTGVVSCVAIAVAGTLFGLLASGLGVRETLLPILLFPVLLPVLIASTRAFDDALGVAAVNGWNWLTFVAGLTVILIVVGLAANYILIED